MKIKPDQLELLKSIYLNKFYVIFNETSGQEMFKYLIVDLYQKKEGIYMKLNNDINKANRVTILTEKLIKTGKSDPINIAGTVVSHKIVTIKGNIFIDSAQQQLGSFEEEFF